MMTERQEVNLYLPHLRPQVDWLAPKLVAVYGVVWVALLVLVSAFDTYQNHALAENVTAKRLELQQLTAQVQALKAQLPKSRAAELDLDMAELGAQVDRRRAISRLISGQDLGNTAGFSGHVESLARHSNGSMSLQGFNLAQGGLAVSLAGEVRKAEVLPAYLEALQNEESFKASHFGQLDIKREEERLTFRMNQALPEVDAL